MKRRADDNEEVVLSRLLAYHAQTAPLAQWYAQRGLLVVINGDQDIDAVGAKIESSLAAL